MEQKLISLWIGLKYLKILQSQISHSNFEGGWGTKQDALHGKEPGSFLKSQLRWVSKFKFVTRAGIRVRVALEIEREHQVRMKGRGEENVLEKVLLDWEDLNPDNIFLKLLFHISPHDIENFHFHSFPLIQQKKLALSQLSS